MSKYDPLWAAIAGREAESLRLSFAEVERILGFPVDHSFLTYKKELPAHGWEFVKLSMKEQWIAFRKL